MKTREEKGRYQISPKESFCLFPDNNVLEPVGIDQLGLKHQLTHDQTHFLGLVAATSPVCPRLIDLVSHF